MFTAVTLTLAPPWLKSRYGLEHEGLDNLGDEVMGGGAQVQPVLFQRREAKSEQLTYSCHWCYTETARDGWICLTTSVISCPASTGVISRPPDPQSSMPERARWQWATVDLGETSAGAFHADRRLYTDKAAQISLMVRSASVGRGPKPMAGLLASGGSSNRQQLKARASPTDAIHRFSVRI